jgi:hypothetical protein
LSAALTESLTAHRSAALAASLSSNPEIAVRLDMAQWFTPTAENYFGRISKAGILAALAEIKGAIAPVWVRRRRPNSH